MIHMVRKNAKPVWGTFHNKMCMKCGRDFENGDKTLFGEFCEKCGKIKEKRIKIRGRGREIIWQEYSPACVQCARPFDSGDEVLFGLYCKKCGKKWVKQRNLRMPKLKKARNLESRKEVKKVKKEEVKRFIDEIKTNDKMKGTKDESPTSDSDKPTKIASEDKKRTGSLDDYF